MSECGPPVLFVRCGTTWTYTFLYRDKVTKAPIVIDDLQARGSVVDENGNVVMTLSNTQLAIPTGLGSVVLTVPSTTTQSLSPSNVRRTDLSLYIELFDTGSPPVVTPFAPPFPIIVLPDLTT